MLALHHDQENRVRTLQPKTPGARYPKTPLKVPLNDENAPHGLAGKSILRPKNNNENMMTVGKAGKSSFVTPAQPRTARAPLGNKTTNAKARTGQLEGAKDTVKGLEKTTLKPTISKPKNHGPIHQDSLKLDVHVDSEPVEEEEVEYCPPRPKDIPYESDIIPRGALTFEAFKPENFLKGYYDHYYNPVDEDGVPIRVREMEEQRQLAFKKLDEQVMKDMDEFDWSVDDIPETKLLKKKPSAPAVAESSQPTVKAIKKPTTREVTKQPPTLAARKAASTLAMTTRPATATSVARKPMAPAPGRSVLNPLKRSVQPRPAATRESSTERATALAASRSTVGYGKGRSVSSAIQGSRPPVTRPPRTLTRSVSTASNASDSTITPARFAQIQARVDEPLKKLEFLSIFDGEEEDDGLLGGSALPIDDDDDFQLKLEN
ncbi:hypothetical protein DL546_004896 [Coniochaeta pulveracea]|uniref:Uncharacterized protein n=1 Tax=Coniochaeta pulveracea TaxID=177199 RepID=A0A420Y2H7_9PEZI|nr:hypothetical protein DL546_004896 [Coniochaeta pulveracea]